MTHKKLLLGVIVLMVASLALVAVACGGGGEATPTPTPTPTATEEPTATAPPTGGAPTLSVGDTWTYTVNWKDPPEETSTFVGTVSSATAAGYDIDYIFDETERKEKASPLNLPVIWMGTMTRTLAADLVIMTEMFTMVDVSGYGELEFVMTGDIDAPALWPLTEGTEFTANYVIDVGGLLEKEYPLTATIEGTESVTVPAGTFECTKIVYWQEDMLRIEAWFSEDVKGMVKYSEDLFWHGPDIWELESYTVAP